MNRCSNCGKLKLSFWQRGWVWIFKHDKAMHMTMRVILCPKCLTELDKNLEKSNGVSS